MAVKPSLDPKWSTSNNHLDNIEPTESLKIGGVPAGGVWGREFLNWQFYAISQWVDWVRSSALDKDNNLSDLTNVNTARTNLGLNTAATNIAANTTGNAATATKLATARTIGGVSFDGSANINLPGVNTAGNQSTTGNAATATKLQTGQTINGTSFDGTANITTANWGTSRNISIAGSSKPVNGGSNVTWSRSEMGMIGEGQVWVDVTAQRAMNVTYTNTTGRSIQVSIYANGFSSRTTLTVNGVDACVATSSAGYGHGFQGQAIIPAGATYQLTGNGGELKWRELR